MKRLLAIVFTLVVCLPLGGVYAQVAKLKASPAQERTIELINYFVQRYHYRPTQLNDELSSRILDRFVESLDANRSYFLDSDIQRFEKMRFRIDDDLRLFQLESIFNVFDVYRERVAGRSAFVEEALVRGFQFDIDENYQFDRTDASWAVDSTELDDIWRKRIKNEYLVLKAAEQSNEQILKILGGRYGQLDQRTSQVTAENVFEIFVNAYLSAVEPHTSYFSPDSFSPAVSVSSELAIGAVLETKNEYTVVQNAVIGDSAELGGRLHSGDKIVGVSANTEKPFIDVIGWRLADVLNLIRGPEGTTVRLEILPSNQPPGGMKRIISIVRGKSRAGLQVAQKSILNFTDTESKIVGTTREDDDTEVEGFKCDALLVEIGRILAGSVNIEHKRIRIGVIRIPTFYIDFEGRSTGKPDYQSVTRDVRRLISTLGPEKIDGLIVDLRGNGGGALTEAADLTGLFMESGPIYQTKDAKDQIKINNDPSFTIEYSGPLLVVVDRDTAGSSEILAGAVQDYRRGIIVGERTFGLGMVGNLVDLSRYARSSEEKLGQMKFTIAELYRVNGDSIQQRGVIPDIVLPVAESNDDHGEKKFDNALPWSHIAPADYKPVANSEFDKFLTQFRKLYEHRIHSDAEFSLLIKGLRFHDSGERKTSISLLAAKRIEKQTEKQKVSKTPFFCATDKFVQEYGNESHCKDVGGTVFATRGLAQAEHNRLKAALDGSTDKDKPSITIPDWDSPEWIAVYSKYSKDYGIELADFKFAEQWGVMDGIRLGCGARGDGYFLVLGKYFRAKGYEFLPLQMAYVFAQPKDILPSYCETDEAKKWVILQSAILNLWDTKGVGFAITDQVIAEFEQLIDSRYFGSKESTKKKIKKEDTGRDR